MTTSRDLVINTLNHELVERAPRDLWPSPEVKAACADELAEVQLRFPSDIIRADFKYPYGKRGRGSPNRTGRYTDAWGCTWRVSHQGAVCEIEDSPLADRKQIAEYKPPFELVEDGKQVRAKLDAVNRQCADVSRFVLVETQVLPFNRLCFLRGFDAAAADLQSGNKHTETLLEMLHDFSCREMEMWAETDVDGVIIRDDLGSDDALLLESALWRNVFKPFYREYCKILHAKDEFVFFRTNGNVGNIFGDLVRIDIDAVHTQLFSMNIEQLAKRYRGRVTFWGEIDRQRILPFGSLDEIRKAVLRVRRALDFGNGGIIAQCRWDAEVPIQNIIAVFEQWMAPLPMHL